MLKRPERGKFFKGSAQLFGGVLKIVLKISGKRQILQGIRQLFGGILTAKSDIRISLGTTAGSVLRPEGHTVLTLQRDRKAVHRGSGPGKRKLIYLRLGKTDYVSLGSTVKGSPIEDKTERPEDPAPARSRSNHIVAPFQVGGGTSDASWHVQLRLKRTVHVTDRLMHECAA